jgi:hypothetical protein
MRSTRACLKTRSQKSGAKGANACTILGGRVRTSITSFWRIAVTSVPYPFCSQMAKVEQKETVWKIRMRPESGSRRPLGGVEEEPIGRLLATRTHT